MCKFDLGAPKQSPVYKPLNKHYDKQGKLSLALIGLRVAAILIAAVLQRLWSI